MPLIQYNTEGDPTETGVYACRVPMDECPELLEDKFLMWFDGSWGYLRSDAKYRGPVLGWLGPLQRRMPSNGQLHGPRPQAEGPGGSES